jgi:site-specific recombinase XerD
MATEGTLTTESNQLLFATVTPDLARWADAFITAKRSESLSRKTLAIYAAALQTFTRWAGLRGLAAVEAITANDLRTFMLWLAQEGRNAGGQHICFRVLRTFLRWYAVEVEPAGWRNPIEKVKPPKLPETPINPVELGDVSRLLAVASGGRLGTRDRAIVLCLIDCGLRANELTGLDVEDFDFANGGLLVRHGKGSRVRTVYAGHKTRKAIRAWLRERGGKPGALFTNDTGGRLTYSGLRQMIRRLAERAGMHEPALHSFRRGYALAMLRAGCDVVTLSRLMGHSDLTLLRRYTKQTGEDLRLAAERHSPADRV